MSLFYLLSGLAVAVLLLIISISRWSWPPLFSLLLAALGLGFYFGLSGAEVIAAVSSGFGGILAGIGLVVVLGSIIGVALERSGAALVIAETVLAWFGPQRPALAMAIIGALVSIPVFCDSGFVLLAGVSRSLAKKSGQSLGVLSLALAAGLYTTHTLVPPTPGPIAAAGQLGADAYLGTIMLLGGLLTIPLVLLATWLSKRLGASLQLEALTQAEESPQLPLALPSPWLSFLPLLLPILLIAMGTISSFFDWKNSVAALFRFAGQPVVALFLGCLPALWLARKAAASWSEWTQKGIALSGPILIITGAGGAFGAVLKASPLQAAIEQSLGESTLSFPFLLLLAFTIAAVLKTAQGSSTNALVITAGMMAPLAAASALSGAFAYALLVLAIGGGAMTVSHANDSYFWVVSKFSGMPLGQAYRSYTLLTGIMGLAVLGLVLLLSVAYTGLG